MDHPIGEHPNYLDIYARAIASGTDEDWKAVRDAVAEYDQANPPPDPDSPHPWPRFDNTDDEPDGDVDDEEDIP